MLQLTVTKFFPHGSLNMNFEICEVNTHYVGGK